MRALVVDDDRILADLVAFTLRREGLEVVQAYDGETALSRWAEAVPDIVILDVNLPHSVPKLDGFDICQRIRAESDVPIILLTVRGEEEDIVRGLQLGADDYITKPFSPRQLVARMQAILRRAGKAAPLAMQRVGDLNFDASRREARVDGNAPVSLTPLEARLLGYLMLNAGQYLSTDDLIAHVWGPSQGNKEMLRQLVKRLRVKIEHDPASPVYIENLPGLGYGILHHKEG